MTDSTVPPDDGPPAAVVAYVQASAVLLGLPLEADQVQRVATHLARTRVLAATLQGLALADDAEPAEVYCPAPFPTAEAEALTGTAASVPT